MRTKFKIGDLVRRKEGDCDITWEGWCELYFNPSQDPCGTFEITSIDKTSIDKNGNFKLKYATGINYDFSKFELVKSIKTKFRVGDIIVGNEGSNQYTYTCKRNNFVGEVIKVVHGNGSDIEVKSLEGDTGENQIYWVESKCFDLKEPTQKSSEGKLIKNKMETKEIAKIDSKILKAAKKEVELERSKKQQEEAAEYYRNLMNKKDDIEKVVKEQGLDLKEIDKQLKVFNVK